MLCHTEIWDAPSTDLGIEIEKHKRAFRFNDKFSTNGISTRWVDAVRNRSEFPGETTLKALSDEMLRLLKDPHRRTACFTTEVENVFESLRLQAYPLCTQILEEIQRSVGVARDYTLSCIDMGQLRRIEDEAFTDASMNTFVADMLRLLTTKSKNSKTEIYRQVFDVYSEALVCRLLRQRSGPNLTIEKIPETKAAGPDFKCELRPDGDATKAIEFYIEVKSLDVVDAPYRIPEMQSQDLDRNLELEDKLEKRGGVVIVEGEIAPNRGIGNDPDYDPRSVRKNIELVAQKASSNFKPSQFKRGPTFALANVIRLNLMGQGLGTLAPIYYDDHYGSACISGVLWNVAFGRVGDPIYKSPEFEGSGTDDGRLERSGVLVDEILNLGAAGLIVLHWDEGYRCDGFYDASSTLSGGNWSNLQVEEVFYSLCGDYNDRRNQSADKYARFQRRTPVP